MWGSCHRAVRLFKDASYAQGIHTAGLLFRAASDKYLNVRFYQLTGSALAAPGEEAIRDDKQIWRLSEITGNRDSWSLLVRYLKRKLSIRDIIDGRDEVKKYASGRQGVEGG